MKSSLEILKGFISLRSDKTSRQRSRPSMGNSQSKGTTLEGPGHSSSTPFLEHNKDRKTGNFVLQTGHSNLISGSKHAVKRDLPVLSSRRAQLRKVLKSDPDNVKGLPLTLHHSVSSRLNCIHSCQTGIYTQPNEHIGTYKYSNDST